MIDYPGSLRKRRGLVGIDGGAGAELRPDFLVFWSPLENSRRFSKNLVQGGVLSRGWAPAYNEEPGK